MNFKKFTKNLSILLTAVMLSIAVWILAVTTTDPVEKRNYSRPIDLEVTGLDTALTITSDLPDQISLTLSAPDSVWSSDLNNTDIVRAIVDLSGLEAGNHSLPLNIQIDAKPVKIESYSPKEVDVRLEQLYSKDFIITLVQPSSPAIGYEAGAPELSVSTATVSGPASLMEQVVEVRATLDISQASEDISRNLELQALDENGVEVSGVSINPETIHVDIPITQRGGYRTISVNLKTNGVPASGYQTTGYQYSPRTVMVFSTDPDLIDELPGYIETEPVNLTDAIGDLEVSVPLAVPEGVTVVGESIIKVSVSISPIQGISTLPSLPVEIVGLSSDLQVTLSSDQVDIVLSGPLPTLENMNASTDVRVFIDLTNYVEGIYQFEPMVELTITGVLVESRQPEIIEVEITPLVEPTPTP